MQRVGRSSLSNDAVASVDDRARIECICLAQDAQIAGRYLWETRTPSLFPAEMTSRQHQKLGQGASGLALLRSKQVREGPLWEMISPWLAPDNVFKLLRTATKEWNNGS